MLKRLTTVLCILVLLCCAPLCVQAAMQGEREPNDTAANANPMYNGKYIAGKVDDEDLDLYRLKVEKESYIEIVAASEYDCVYLVLCDEDLNIVAYGEYFGNSNDMWLEGVAGVAEPGTYYAAVYTNHRSKIDYMLVGIVDNGCPHENLYAPDVYVLPTPTQEGLVEWICGECNAYVTLPAYAAKITAEPKTGYAKRGDTVKTTVEATGDDLTYQWYIKNAGQTQYRKSSVTTPTYSCTMTDTSKDRLAYCVVTDLYGNSVRSKTVALRMQATITEQPQDAWAVPGNVVKTGVSAIGEGLTYTWYIKNPGKTSFSKSSVTSATYSCKMSEAINGRQVYCVVKDKYGKTDKSEIATLTMPKPLKIISQSKTTYTKKNYAARAWVTAEGDGLTYQWYIKNAGATKYGKSSVKSPNYSVQMTDASKDRLVYCVVTDPYGNTARTETVRLRMAATITKQPTNVIAENGAVAKTSVTAVGDGLTYQWYIKNAGQTSFSKSAATTASYSCKMSATTNGRQVYCVVTDKYGKTHKSNTVTLKMG